MDRSTRGKLEKKESKVRQMYLSNYDHKRKELNKNQVSFALLNSVNRDGSELAPLSLNIGTAIKISSLVSHMKKRVRKNSTSLHRDSSSSTFDISKKQPSSQATATQQQVNSTYPVIFFRNAFTHEHRPLLVRP
jgi:hypothetical protein